MQIVFIEREPVELYKILKFEGIAGSGGQAKQLIEDREVTVNNEIETRKRRKMLAGDVVSVFDITFTLQLSSTNDSARSN